MIEQTIAQYLELLREQAPNVLPPGMYTVMPIDVETHGDYTILSFEVDPKLAVITIDPNDVKEVK